MIHAWVGADECGCRGCEAGMVCEADYLVSLSVPAPSFNAPANGADANGGDVRSLSSDERWQLICEERAALKAWQEYRSDANHLAYFRARLAVCERLHPHDTSFTEWTRAMVAVYARRVKEAA